MDTILITGACGQIGSELTLALRKEFGPDRVIATDLNPAVGELLESGPFETLDVMYRDGIARVMRKYKPTQVYHLAAMLSATAEKYPLKGWAINMDSLLYMLEAAVEHKVGRFFWPSSIGAFGPGTPKLDTPQHTVMDPTTVYGISKLAGEGWCHYFHLKKGLDTRSIRYPGLISYKTHPGGGTTDYAIDIFHQALREGQYTCFLGPNTRLPMMYMPDAIRGTLELMDAPAAELSVRTSYNLGGMSFTPEEIAAQIAVHVDGFEIAYEPDFRQEIANSWPQSIDDSQARNDWAWQPEFDLPKMTEDMLANLAPRLSARIGRDINGE